MRASLVRFLILTLLAFGRASSTDAADNYDVIARFHRSAGPSPSALILGPDGNYWGTGLGGTFFSGVIYKVTPDGEMTFVAELNREGGPRRGSISQGGLLLAGDGNFYGTAQGGGLSGFGTVFGLTPEGDFTTLVDFTGAEGAVVGAFPHGRLALGGDSNIYGTTAGANSRGTAFRLTPGGIFTHLGELPGNAIGTGFGGLTRGSDGNLFGATSLGGTGGTGVFFRVTITGELAVLANFDAAEGAGIRGPLLLAADGKFYGVKRNGGSEGRGLLFRASAAGALETLDDFDGGGFGAGLANPVGALVQDADGAICGVANRGGANNRGGLFSWRAGAGKISLFDCKPDGSPGYPIGGLFRAPDGKLLGTASNDGDLITYSPSYVSKLVRFSDISDDITAHPNTPTTPLLVASDGAFYGGAAGVSQGTTSGSGAIYRVKADGSIEPFATLPQNSELFDQRPVGRLMEERDGNFYGVTPSGGGARRGGIFRVTPGGAASFLYEFTTGGPGYPTGGVIKGNDDAFYGMLDSGATANGAVYRLTREGAFSVLVDFTGKTTGTARGSSPRGELLLASDGNLYGVTVFFGAKGHGTLFRLTPAGVCTTLVDFTGKSGSFPGSAPTGSLVQGADGHLYGTTERGGAKDFGTAFRVALAGEFKNLAQFSSNGAATRGAYPSSLVVGADGAFYGTTSEGGETRSYSNDHVAGTVFRLTPDGLVSSVVEFGALIDEEFFPGHRPLPGVTLGADGALYGVHEDAIVADGGPGFTYSGPGVVYRVKPGAAGSEPTLIAAKGANVPGEPDGTTLAAFGPLSAGPFAGTLAVGAKKVGAIFAPDGHVRVRISGPAGALASSAVAKLGVPNGDAVLATLKAGAGGATAKSDIVLLAGLRDGPVRVAAQEGAPLTAPAGMSIKSFGTFDGRGTAIFFLATLQGTGVTPKNDSALCAALADGSVRVIVREGEPVDGAAGSPTVAVIGTLVALKGTLAEGRWRGGDEAIGVRLTLSDKRQVLYTVPAVATSAADWTRWIATGDTLADPPLAGAKVAAVGFPGFGDAGPAHVIGFTLNIGGVTAASDTALLRENTGDITLLAREGEPAPDATGEDAIGRFKSFSDPVSGSAGRVALAGTLIPGAAEGVTAKTDSGLWYAADGDSLRLLAQEGGPAAGGGAWSSFLSLALPDGPGSGPVFTAKLVTDAAAGVTAADSTGLWTVDRTGALRRLLRAGEQLVISGAVRTVKKFAALTGSAGSLGAASGYDEQSVTVHVVCTDGTEARLELPIP